MDVGNATLNGVGSDGNSLEQIDSGAPEPPSRGLPDVVQTGMQLGANALNEGLNGRSEGNVVLWNKDQCYGYYVKDVSEETGRRILKAWVGVK